MIFCTHHVPQLGELQAGGHSIQSTETLKYLGVDLCHKQHHSRHLKRVVNKASRITNDLTCLMPNKRVPKSRSSRQLVNVGNSIIRYGVATWERWVLDKDTHSKTVQRAHRLGDSPSRQRLSDRETALRAWSGTNGADPQLPTRRVGDMNAGSVSHHGKQRKMQHHQTRSPHQMCVVNLGAPHVRHGVPAGLGSRADPWTCRSSPLRKATEGVMPF
uniref:Uncharacterized protein n=1 Tax=Anopheles melas TaxID=34690 RepID=A0A182TSX9_9DIPT